MGSYLSAPVLDKHTEVGCDLDDTNTPVRWAVVDMQGWRKTMEDAHVARTDVVLPGIVHRHAGNDDGDDDDDDVVGGSITRSDNVVTNENAKNIQHGVSSSSSLSLSSSSPQHAKVFAVFDGHGGAEVARFCSIYLVPMLTSRSHWRDAGTINSNNSDNNNNNNDEHQQQQQEQQHNMASCVAQALIDTFHELDRLIDDPNWRCEIEKWKDERPPPYVPGSGGGGGQHEESQCYDLEMSGVGDAEVADIEMEAQQQCRQTIMDASDFSAVDDDEEDEEENDGEAADFMDHESSSTGSSSSGNSSSSEGREEEGDGEAMGTDDDDDDNDDGNNNQSSMLNGVSTTTTTTAGNSFNVSSNMTDRESDNDEVFEDSLYCERTEDSTSSTGGLENEQSDGIVHDDESDGGTDELINEKNDNHDRGQFEGTVSTVVAAAASALKLSGKKTERSPSGMMHLRNDTFALFQKILRMNGPDAESNADKVDIEGEEEDTADSDSEKMMINGSSNSSSSGGSSNTNVMEVNDLNGGIVDNNSLIPTKTQLLNPPTGIVPVSASVPTRIQNGRKICNLPDHPVHAGCTSVVSVIVGRTLVVANAGDSRAVICRAGGVAEPLSFDHKPFHNREMNRITNAGGFVNQFGRVNGNLNLSRSIGDLKYKQVPGIPPAEQMITAEPDVLSTTLWPGDEFIVLGCDGIWDCLSNEECVKYVRDRINSKLPHEIGEEMLDEIVSADPRASQGIGGDNMTIIIVDLLPNSRPYSNGNESNR